MYVGLCFNFFLYLVSFDTVLNLYESYSLCVVSYWLMKKKWRFYFICRRRVVSVGVVFWGIEGDGLWVLLYRLSRGCRVFGCFR